MHYLLATLAFVILAFALPVSALIMFALYLVASALVVKVSAGLIARESYPLSTCLKAVIYCGLFSIIAFVVCMNFMSHAPLTGVLLLPVLVFAAQVIAYCTALDLRFGPSVGVSLCTLLLGWGLSMILKVSLSPVQTLPL